MKPFVSVLVQCLEQTERAARQAVFGFIDEGGFGAFGGREVTQYCWLLPPTQMIYWPVRNWNERRRYESGRIRERGGKKGRGK